MKRLIIAILALVFSISEVQAATVNARIITDKPLYLVGQTVNWEIQVWALSGGNQGIGGISLNLADSFNEVLTPAVSTGTLMLDLELTDTDFGLAEKFFFASGGLFNPTSATLEDIFIAQFPDDRVLNIANDNIPHTLCKGSFTATALGTHDLTVAIVEATYWPNASAAATDFQTQNITNATFKVVPVPTICGQIGTVFLPGDISGDCYINLEDFAILSVNWLSVNCGVTGCNGANLDADNDVDLDDLAILVANWLACSDPANSACDAYWR
ncbi:MAG: hypothetical protein JEZ07_14835 [Phycisphaerae bacterium]|nr:hypothetical protein [Phycisphaerae bacterium]